MKGKGRRDGVQVKGYELKAAFILYPLTFTLILLTSF